MSQALSLFADESLLIVAYCVRKRVAFLQGKESQMTDKADYILIKPLENDDGYLAYAIGLEGCVVEGRTEEETLANLKAAIAGWRRARSLDAA